MKRILYILFAIAFTIVVALPANAQNDTIRIKLHGLSIIPPKHFEIDSISDKIFHQGTMTYIQTHIVTNCDFKRITSAITNKYMKTQGLDLLDKQETTMQDGNEAIIYRSKFKSSDANGKEMDFIRLMLFTGKENTIWVTADFPECMTKQLEEPVTNSIKTILPEK